MNNLTLEPRSLIAVSNVTAHPSATSVPITVLLYNDPFLCCFNVPVKGLKIKSPGNYQVKLVPLLTVVRAGLNMVLKVPWHRAPHCEGTVCATKK